MQRAGIATSAASLCTTESRSSVERRIVDPEERPCAARAALVRYQFDANVDQRLGDMRISSELIPRNLLVRSAVLAGTLIIVPQLAGPLPGQDRPDTTAVLIGEVQSAMSGDPVINAVVFLRASQRGAITDSAGSFTLDSIPPGTDTLVIRYPGIDAQSTIEIVPPCATRNEIVACVTLDDVVSWATIDRIVTGSTLQHVIVAKAVYCVIAQPTDDDVLTTVTIEQIAATTVCILGVDRGPDERVICL
ncbi:MAG: carboxypeptidase-like regulatory domain-containing protein, partial [Gemmatimonadales bacterium]